VLIALSTYNEPAVTSAVVNSVAASSVVHNEPHQLHEPDELEEVGTFSELLNDLLKKSDETVTDESLEFSDVQINFQFSTVDETNFSDVKEFQKNFAEDALDIEIPEEHMSVFQGMGVSFNVQEPVQTDIGGDFSPEITNLNVTEQLPETGLEQDIFKFAQPKTAVSEDSQIAAASSADENLSLEKAAGMKENVFNENIVKEDRVLSKNEINNGGQNLTFTADKKHGENSDPLRKDTTNNKSGRIDDMRSRSRRDRIAFEIRDQRTARGAGEVNSQNRSFSAVEATAARSLNDLSTREITLELRLPGYNNNSIGHTQAQTTWEARAGTSMEDMLARELHQNFNGDIVRHASMALLDGGEGTIRINLKPESLGNVKIRLEMTENKITGIILVESEEALNAFRKEISSLEQAFRESGFTDADLNLSLASNGQNENDWKQEQDAFTPRMIASLYDDSFEYDAINMVDVFVGQKSGSINLFA
jgi:flagellar hook-length control protein FliK